MLRRVMNTDVEMIHGKYGEFKVLVDGQVVSDAGRLSMIWMVPSNETIVAAVRKAYSTSADRIPLDAAGA